MYRAYGLLQPGSDFTLEEAEQRLTAKFPDATVRRAGDQITTAKGDWEIELRLNGDPGVLAESIAIAEKIGGLTDAADIASCGRRVEVWSETRDPTTEHLADFQALLEVLRTFTGIILVDPSEPTLM
jgi:hypothetical protein